MKITVTARELRPTVQYGNREVFMEMEHEFNGADPKRRKAVEDVMHLTCREAVQKSLDEWFAKHPHEDKPTAEQKSTPQSRPPAQAPRAAAPAQEREPGDVLMCPDCGMEKEDCLCGEDPFAGEGASGQDVEAPALPEGVEREVVKCVNAKRKDRTPYMTNPRDDSDPKPYHYCKTESGKGFCDFTTYIQEGDTVLLQKRGKFWNVYDPNKGALK